MQILDTWASWAQIISLPVAIVAILLTIWMYFRGKQRRAITCELDTISPIEIKAGEALKGDIEIHYKGKPVENLFLVRANLRNTGNLPIRQADVVEPVTFTFDSAAELLRQPDVTKKKPENLKITWVFNATDTIARPNIASLNFELLNPGEGLTIEFTCTGKSGVPQVTARIEGIKEIAVLESEEAKLRDEIGIGIYATVGVLAVSLFAYLVFKPSRMILAVLVGIVLGVLWGLVKTMWAWLRYRMRRKRNQF